MGRFVSPDSLKRSSPHTPDHLIRNGYCIEEGRAASKSPH